MKLGEALELTSDLLPDDTKVFLDHIDPAWVEQALEATGTATIRRRRLPAEQVFWLVVGMALMRNRPITDVADKLSIALPASTGAVAPSALAEARQRLGASPMEWLFHRSAEHWVLASADRFRWKGLQLLGVDGTKFSVPDSEANDEAFHKHSSDSGTAGYPMVRLVALMALESHVCLDAALDSYAVSELELAQRLWDRVPDNSLTIVDKGFFYATELIPLQQGGQNRHWLTRARKTTSWKVLKELGEGDLLVELELCHKTRKKYPELPRTWTMRAVLWRDAKEGNGKYLVTSLLDAERYPTKAVRELYVERWDQEIAFGELKTSQLAGRYVLRSRTPEGVHQELWGTLIAYNLIRVEMEAIAVRAKVSPRRVSFIQSLRLIADEWLWLVDTRSPGAIPQHLARLREELTRLILPKRRKRPKQPRAVKPRPRKYPSKKSPHRSRGSK